VDDGRVHVCLVCHTEPDVWDGGFMSIDIVLLVFLDSIVDVLDSERNSPSVCWCMTSQVVHHRQEPFLELAEQGHEIGVHSHFPAVDGSLEHQQELNRDNLDSFDEWLPRLCGTIKDAGFPSPRTHVTWMFAYRDHMTKILTQNGIDIDCSVCYGGAHFLPDGFLLADSSGRDNGKPYVLSELDHSKEGNSRVLELPVSGGFGSYWEPDGNGGFRYFNPVASDEETEKMVNMFSERLKGLSPGEVDIFHIHFHLYEFLPSGGFDRERLGRAMRILNVMANDSRVKFSTPSAAADDWFKTKYG
jgi:hypothetical protein